MPFSTVPSYSADSEATISSEVPDDIDGSSCFAQAEGTIWVLNTGSTATVGDGVLATRSGTGRWIAVNIGSVASASDWLYGVPQDGSRSIAGTAASLATIVAYSTLELQANAVLPAAAHLITCSTELIMGANSVIHVDGSTNAVAGTQAGAAGAVAGSLAQTGINGASGGNAGAAGGSGNVSTSSTALGGNGGAGGAGSAAGGPGGTAVAPFLAGVGRFKGWECFFEYATSGFAPTIYKPRGGAPGGGGGGGPAAVGSGGGGPGGIMLIRAKKITVSAGALFRAKGGNGTNTSNAGAGAGGGAGGGFITIICNEFVMPPGSAYADFFDVSGGTGGVASGGGTSGSNGSAGRVNLFVGGLLVYSTP